MRKTVLALVLAALAMPAAAQVTLDSCRAMALRNNKQVLQANLDIEKANYQKKEAKAAYLPSFDLMGGYFYNSRKISLLSEDARLPVLNFDLASQSYQYGTVINPLTGGVLEVNGQQVPAQVALLPKSGMTYNIHNLMGGAITLTQPIYMGGKITAMNKMAEYAQELASTMRRGKVEDILYNVDAAYWQVVSLKSKQKLARSYVELVRSLDDDVKAMVQQGVATRANQLTVDVKLNEANVDQTKVDNGLVLARMLLAELCGLPVNETFTLADEDRDDLGATLNATSFDMNTVYSNRYDIHALELATNIYDQKVKVARSEMLPKVAALGAFHVTNPNTYNGFKNRFGAAFTVGVTLKMPLWHWGGLTAKVRQAETDAAIKRLELADAKDKIELQVNQASFRYQEAYKTYEATKANLAEAEENLRIANIAFKEGVGTVDDVLAAQTAWLKANSEKVDAEIDVQLSYVYLNKVMGTMKY